MAHHFLPTRAELVLAGYPARPSAWHRLARSLRLSVVSTPTPITICERSDPHRCRLGAHLPRP